MAADGRGTASISSADEKIQHFQHSILSETIQLLRSARDTGSLPHPKQSRHRERPVEAHLAVSRDENVCFSKKLTLQRIATTPAQG